MPYRLDKIFKTITANPYQRNTYFALAPCEALKPYIRCFWYSKSGQYNRIYYDIQIEIAEGYVEHN